MKKTLLLLALFAGGAQAHNIDQKIFAFDYNPGGGVRTEYLPEEIDCRYRIITSLNAGELVRPCYEISISEALKRGK